MQKRRRFKQEVSLEERLLEQAKRLRAEARSLRPGAQRSELLRRAKELEAGMRIANVLLSTSSEDKVLMPGRGDVTI
jgi:hypothetical protein